MATMLTTLASPTRIVSFDGLEGETLARAALCLSGSPSSRVLIVRDPRPFPSLDPAIEHLATLRPVAVLDRVVPNPRSEDVAAMAVAGMGATGAPPGLVIGIGGGSALDSAKALALMLANPGDLDDYLGPMASRKPAAKGPKLLLIPTTTGTGSEVTRFGVYTMRSGRKATLASPFLQADAALLVAEAVADIPPALLAATAYDAITHALETLWNRNATELSDALAHEALESLMSLVRPAFEARSSGRRDPSVGLLLEAACAAGVAFNLTGTAAIHALSFILSEEWHQSHGVACAFFADSVYAANSSDAGTRAKLAKAARRMADRAGYPGRAGVEGFAGDTEAAAWLGERLVELRDYLGLPGNFRDIGLSPGELSDSRIALLFDKVQDDAKLKNNILALDAAAVRKLVRAKLG